MFQWGPHSEFARHLGTAIHGFEPHTLCEEPRLYICEPNSTYYRNVIRKKCSNFEQSCVTLLRIRDAYYLPSGRHWQQSVSTGVPLQANEKDVCLLLPGSFGSEWHRSAIHTRSPRVVEERFTPLAWRTQRSHCQHKRNMPHLRVSIVYTEIPLFMANCHLHNRKVCPPSILLSVCFLCLKIQNAIIEKQRYFPLYF